MVSPLVRLLKCLDWILCTVELAKIGFSGRWWHSDCPDTCCVYGIDTSPSDTGVSVDISSS